MSTLIINSNMGQCTRKQYCLFFALFITCKFVFFYFVQYKDRQTWESLVAGDGTGNKLKFELIKLLLWISPLSLGQALPGRLKTIDGRHAGQVRRTLELCFKLLLLPEKHLWILISLKNAFQMTSIHSHIGFYQWFQSSPPYSGDFNASWAACVGSDQWLGLSSVRHSFNHWL